MYNVVIPEGVTEIGEGAFNECVDIVSINIPKSLKKVGEYAFYCCEELTDVYYGGTEEDWKKIIMAEHNEWLKNANIHYNSDMEEFEPELPDKVTLVPKDETDTVDTYTAEAEIIKKRSLTRIGVIAGSVAVVIAAAVVVTVVVKKKKS